MTAFDHHTEVFARDWRDIYASLRADDPVAYTPAHGGFFVVTKYADARSVLLRPEEFVCRREIDLDIDGQHKRASGGVTIPRIPFRMGMMEMDPPESSFYRKILVPWFSPKSVAAATEHMRDLATWCIDKVIERGSMDVVDDLANPLPALITLDLLGLPLDKWERYGAALHHAAYLEKGSAKEMDWLLKDLRAVLADRRENPPETLTPVDALLAAEKDGVSLPFDIVVEMVYMLLTGGVDTSTGLIAHGLRWLSQRPDQREELRADPSLIPGVVDEMLRYFTPGTGVARTAVADTEINGVAIHAGDRVLLALGAANTDPHAFERPDAVDIHRDAARHLAFGAGLHRCLGTFLAKAEMEIVIEEVLRRLPDLQVDELGVLPYATTPSVMGYRAMPATFTPGTPIRPVDHGSAPPPRAERLKSAAAALAASQNDVDAEDAWQPRGSTGAEGE